MTVVDDLRYAIRHTRRRPGRATLAVLILAIGIGAATAVFSVVDQTVLRRPPFTAGERLVDVQNIRRGGGGGSAHSAEKVLGWREQPSVFERLETFVPRTLDLTGDGEPERITALGISPGLFDMLGVQPSLGRPFIADDFVPGADPLIIVSARLAERRLGGVNAALGRRLAAGGQGFTVIGVMSDAFTLLGREQAWTPVDPSQNLGQPRARDFFAVGRLVAGLSPAQAQQRANGIADRLQADDPILGTWDIRVDEKRVAATTPATRAALLALLGGVGCLWLLACVSAMQLVVASIAEHQVDLRIRASLGASRAALVRQSMIHVAMLAFTAGALGSLAAYWAVRAFAVSAPSILTFWRTAPLTVDARVLALTLAATAAAAVVAGLLPALWSTRPGALDVRGAASTMSAPPGSERLSSLLVATQVACAVVLAVGAGLMFRTIENVGRIPLGFDPTGVVAMSVDGARQATAGERYDFMTRVLDRVRRAPGVSAAAVAGGLTYRAYGGERLASADGGQLPGDPLLAMNNVGDGYFEAMRIRLVSGRTFAATDVGENVVVLGKSLASSLWPRGDAVGHTLRSLDDDRAWTVIGVVEDLDVRPSYDRPVPLQWYLPRARQGASTAQTPALPAYRLIVRGTSADAAIAAAKAAVWAESPDQPIERIMRATDELRDVFGAHFLVQRLASGLSAIGLLIACVGVFGVLAQMVARRRREIGVRMALGATSGRVAGMVIRRAGGTMAVGVVLGLAVAIVLARGLQSVLFGVTPLDPKSLSAAVLVVVSTGLLAALWPARSAARVDPAVAIREE
ncbi:MAG: ABC transporter permease [Vicinamibacterales bacterium]